MDVANPGQVILDAIVRQAEQANKQYSLMASASVSVSRFLPRLPERKL